MSSGMGAAPVVRCRVAGVPLPAAVLAGLTSVVVEQQIGRPAQLRLGVAGAAAEELGRLASRDVGIDIRVDGHDIGLFSGEVAGIEERWDRHGHRTVVLRAYDALHALRATRRCAAYRGRSAIEITEDLVGAVGLGVQTNRTAPAHVSVHQAGQTDLAFVRRLLAAHGLLLTLRGDTVHLVERSGVGATLRLRPGEELVELSIDRRTADPPGAGVLGWNAGRGAAVASGDDDQLVGWMLDDDFADELTAALDGRARSLKTVARGVAVGDTAIRPGTPIDVYGGVVGALRDADDLVISTAVHRIDANEGYLTEFSTEAIDDEPVAAPATLTLGIVIDLDDPENRGRVQVELPAFGDLETWWMPVVSAGAGDGVGIVALPDVGATVAVLGPLDQPASGVVLGGIFGTSTPPGDPVVDGRSRRFVARLAGGTQVLLADDGSRVLIENGAGSRIEMSPDAVTLHAAVDLEIAAPGRHLLFRADQIDFERA